MLATTVTTSTDHLSFHLKLLLVTWQAAAVYHASGHQMT